MYVCFKHRYVASPYHMRHNDGITYTSSCPGGDTYRYCHVDVPKNRDDHKGWKDAEAKQTKLLSRRIPRRRLRRR